MLSLLNAVLHSMHACMPPSYQTSMTEPAEHSLTKRMYKHHSFESMHTSDTCKAIGFQQALFPDYVSIMLDQSTTTGKSITCAAEIVPRLHYSIA